MKTVLIRNSARHLRYAMGVTTLIFACSGCGPILTQQFYNNTGRTIRFEEPDSFRGRVWKSCRPGDSYSTGGYLGDVHTKAMTVVVDGEKWSYRDIYGPGDAHLRLLPLPIPGWYWIIRFQIDKNGALRLIPRGERFPFSPSAPQPEGFPKYPSEKKRLGFPVGPFHR